MLRRIGESDYRSTWADLHAVEHSRHSRIGLEITHSFVVGPRDLTNVATASQCVFVAGEQSVKVWLHSRLGVGVRLVSLELLIEWSERRESGFGGCEPRFQGCSFGTYDLYGHLNP